MTKGVKGKSASKDVGRQEKKKVGRPSSFIQEVADDICSLLAQGESLRKICDRPGMPSLSMVFRWVNEKPEFREQYARARETQADFLLDEVLEIADTASIEEVQVAKLRVESRKWYITKVAPKKYGDKITQEISGSDGGAIQVEVKKEIDLSVYTDDELRLLRELKRKQSEQ